jgi:hypothetical protein
MAVAVFWFIGYLPLFIRVYAGVQLARSVWPPRATHPGVHQTHRSGFLDSPTSSKTTPIAPDTKAQIPVNVIMILAIFIASSYAAHCTTVTKLFFQKEKFDQKK